jgi:U6 snRNA-associated Sm-like protein LSm5
MKSQTEFTGTLVGFDDFVNMVLEDVTQYSEDGKTELKQILLNGSNIAM